MQTIHCEYDGHDWNDDCLMNDCSIGVIVDSFVIDILLLIVDVDFDVWFCCWNDVGISFDYNDIVVHFYNVHNSVFVIFV